MRSKKEMRDYGRELCIAIVSYGAAGSWLGFCFGCGVVTFIDGIPPVRAVATVLFLSSLCGLIFAYMGVMNVKADNPEPAETFETSDRE